ncbi:serine/threonine protein kinase [bacterium]|nr:serine/threonine protein kinase [bacterium]
MKRAWLALAQALLLVGAPAAQPSEVRTLIRTFPTCKIYWWQPGDPEFTNDQAENSNGILGNFVDDSNRLVTLSNVTVDKPVTLRFVYHKDVEWLKNNPAAVQALPSRTLMRRDLEGPQYPKMGMPILVLETPREWLAFLQPPWAVAAEGTGLLGMIWLRRRRRGQATPAVVAGFQVDRFRLGHSLGKGGAGEVFAAKDDLGQPVAIKLMHADPSEQDVFKRFQREIQICSQLNHPNVVRLLDWGQSGEILYLAMELLEGETLGDLLRRREKLTPDEFLPLWKGLGSALQALHQRGLIHRDIKPENLFVRSQGTLVLMDFGISLGQDLTRATGTGMVLGTPAYMAPEQVSGQPEPATDQYAAGVVAFVCLTGRRPFEAADAMAIAYQHVHATPPSPRQLNPELPVDVDRVILKMMAKQPKQRYASIQEATSALEQAFLGGFSDTETVATS